MNFETYLKAELEKMLFIEINEDLTLDLAGKPIMNKGEYPIKSQDLVKLGSSKSDALTPGMLIDGMLHVLGCDPKFKYAELYKRFLLNTEGMESYIIMRINEVKDEEVKKSLILTNALAYLYQKKEYKYNLIILMMKLYESTNQSFIEDEIVKRLEILVEEYSDFTLPYFHLGKYYVDKDIDKAKIYLRKCLENNTTAEEARKILYDINCVEKYDEAVEQVKNGQGLEAIKTLIPICTNDPENLDAKYYLAVALRQIGNNSKALMYLKELTEFAERAEVYSEIAINLAELEDFEGAMEYFKKALKITPDDSGIICNIGACQLNLSQIEEAQKTFELANRINPKDEIAIKWLNSLKKMNK